jgi:hypothetical protein
MIELRAVSEGTVDGIKHTNDFDDSEKATLGGCIDP